MCVAYVYVNAMLRRGHEREDKQDIQVPNLPCSKHPPTQESNTKESGSVWGGVGWAWGGVGWGGLLLLCADLELPDAARVGIEAHKCHALETLLSVATQQRVPKS